MNTAVKFFTDYLDKKSTRYTFLSDNALTFSFRGENTSSIDISFFFGESGRDVAIYSFNIAKFPEEKVAEACFMCSKLNSQYRWVKFYVDEDNELTAEADALIDPYTTGEECYELLMRTANIIDEAYPTIMKTLWT